jgi:hypothetical protein
MKKLFSTLFHVFFLSCSKATEYVEREREGKLSALQSFQLKVHLMMCAICALYKQQSAFVERKLRREIPTVPLPEATKQRIINTLKQH